jgi:hypothetical protein
MRIDAFDCVTIASTRTSVHDDTARAGTYIELDPKERKFFGFIPSENVKDFPALDTYVGHRIAISAIIISGSPQPVELLVKSPAQLKPASTPLADIENSWCHRSPSPK